MKIKIKESAIPGYFEIFPEIFKDKRGSFVKTFEKGAFISKDLETEFSEEYYSFSVKGVLRGLHFQVPPMDHVKLVYCVRGAVLDAVVDLRIGSPAYGNNEVLEISAEKANMAYIPSGIAHGFYVISDEAILVYRTSTSYSPEHDKGIKWDSAGIPWPDKEPVISDRDKKLPLLSEFKSPFKYKP